MAHVDMSVPGRKEAIGAVMMSYSKPLEGVIFGGWDHRVQMATGSIGKVTCAKSRAGFIRKAPSGRSGPPSIVASMRRVLPGRMDFSVQSYAGLSEYYRQKDEGVVAFLSAPDPKDPTLMHDLQVFADDEGFKSHADTEQHPML
jgi:hypothetical protein